MATIVRLEQTGNTFILLGAGYAAWKTSRPSMLLGNLAPVEDGDEVRAVLVCTADGTTQWMLSSLVEVVSDDGERPEAVLHNVPPAT